MHCGGARVGGPQPCSLGKGPESGPAQRPGSPCGSTHTGDPDSAQPLGCLSSQAGGRGTECPERGRGRGQQGGSLCHPGLPDEAPGQAGPLKRVHPQDGRAPGRDDTASAALLLCYRRLPLTGGPTLYPQLTGRSRWRGSVVGGGQHRPVLRVPATQGCRPAPAPSWSLLWPQPCALSRDAGSPCLDRPRGRGPRRPGRGPRPEEQRDRDDCFIFIRKATKKKDPPPL